MIARVALNVGLIRLPYKRTTPSRRIDRVVVWLSLITLALAAACVVLGVRSRRNARRSAILREALEYLPGAFAVWDDDDRVLYLNDQYRKVHPKAFAALGDHCRYEDLIRYSARGVVPPEEIEDHVRKHLAEQRSASGVPYDRYYADGRWLRVTKAAMPGGGVSGFGADITELKRREQELEAAQEIARLGTWRIDAEDRLTVGGEAAELHGIFDEPVARLADLWRQVPTEDRDRLADEIEAVRGTGEPRKIDYRVQHATLGVRHMETAIRAETHIGSTTRNLFAVVQDATERVQHEKRLEQLAYYDPLTNLPNRALFKLEGDRRLRFGRGQRAPFVILLMDLDHFKDVNDTLGHATGDALLVEAGERMHACLRRRDFLARLGGDEFAVLLDGVSSRDDARAVAERLQEEIARPFVIGGCEVRISLSIGIARAPDDGSDLECLFRNADLALYRMKDDGRSGHRFFDAAMFEASCHRRDMVEALREALAGDGLELHYQPQVDLRRRRVVGCGALLRWRSPVFGYVSPAQFIPIAESSSLIHALGAWVLETACREASQWRSGPLADLSVSVNVSAAQFDQLDLAGDVARVLRLSGLAPARLCLELTESVFLDRSHQRVLETLARLDRLGVRLAIDDFGTGYSSLTYLRNLPFDELKIDGMFITDCAAAPAQRKLLEGIAHLGHGLGLALVAEGVETEEQRDVVEAVGCEAMQGFFFGKPVPAAHLPQAVEDIHRRLAEHDRTPFLHECKRITHQRADAAGDEADSEAA